MSETPCQNCGGSGILWDLDLCHCPKGQKRAKADRVADLERAIARAKALLEREGYVVTVKGSS